MATCKDCIHYEVCYAVRMAGEFQERADINCKQFESKVITIEKAIEHYKYGISHDIFKEPVLSYAKLAVEALSKQLPEKPQLEGDGYDENGDLIYDTGYCPHCNHEFEVYYDATKHCPDCGQALEWGDTNDNG